MINVNGNEYRTLDQDIFVNGKKVYAAFANNKLVYPEAGSERQYYIAKIKGSRTIHASHSHTGEFPLANYGMPHSVRSSVRVDDMYACENHFDITVSFCAVVMSEFPVEWHTDGTRETTNVKERYWGHCLESQNTFVDGYEDLIRTYAETGKFTNETYLITPVEFYNMCCPLYDVSPIPLPNYITSDDAYVDLLVSINMSTPVACGPKVKQSIYRVGARPGSLAYDEAFAKLTMRKTSFPEISSNNGIHRCNYIFTRSDAPHEIQSDLGYRWIVPSNDYYNFRRSSQGAFGLTKIGNDHLYGGLFGSGSALNSLTLFGVPKLEDLAIDFEFDSWAAQYRFDCDIKRNIQTEGTPIDIKGILLTEVPFTELIYQGTYADAPEEHREPRESDLE